MTDNDPDSRSENLGPIDFMSYTEKLIEFLGEDEIRDNYLQMWKERKSSSMDDDTISPSPGPSPGPNAQDPLLLSIHHSYRSFDQYFRTGELGLTDAVLDTATLGRAINELNNCKVVTPNQELIETPFEDIFAHRIRSDENFWDAVFELELAADFSRNGFEVNLIKEGTTGGPDIIVETNESSVWFECKRKRKKTSKEISYQRLREETLRLFWDKVDIGPDSFFARISANAAPKEVSAEDLSDGLGYIVKNQKDQSFVFDGICVEFELLDYYTGEYSFSNSDKRMMDIFSNDSNMERANEFVETINPSPVADILQRDPFSHLDYYPPDNEVGYGDANFMFSDDGTIKIQNANIVFFDFDFDFDLEYWKRITQSFNSAVNNLSGYSPSVAVVDIPASQWDAMEKNDRKYKGETISGKKRLEISMKGILKQNSSVNALVVTSRFENREEGVVERGRFGKTMIQKFPRDPLPESIEDFLIEVFSHE